MEHKTILTVEPHDYNHLCLNRVAEIYNSEVPLLDLIGDDECP